jgi:uncharacterized protein (TIGR00375 family)
MKFIADFHIHSHYSIATSKNLRPEYLDYWARLKGIQVVGTGDFTHPGWLKEMKEKLEPAEPGLFKLKDEYKKDLFFKAPNTPDSGVRFILTSEISSIYKKYDKVRKVHNVILAPDFETVEKIQQRLSKIGNITSDGRPILGLDSRDLLEIALECSDQIFFVPAHIWTPWFSALGNKSGFDSIEECYDDLAHHIFAVETGLSSDPPMNWMCSFLDKYTLISNSDAHSPEKLGREANLFDTDLSYQAIIQALKTSDPKQFLGTIEFFPQEGKYHYDGHRKCGISWDPVQTLKHNEICPVCGKRVTVGVMNRIVQLSDREDITKRKNRPPFYSLIPLKEILSEIIGVGPNTKKVSQAYNSLLQKTGSEFNALLNWSIDDLKEAANDALVEAIKRMRNREVYIKEGFDGEFGRIKVFHEDEKDIFKHQESMFSDLVKEKRVQYQTRKMINFDLEEYRRLVKTRMEQPQAEEKIKKQDKGKPELAWLRGLNQEQLKAAEHLHGPALVIAGPGTGKTRALTCRIANLIQSKNINPENILAVTFTNKAAGEMKERLRILLDNKSTVSKIQVSTFHAFGFSILEEYYEAAGRKKHFSIIDEADKERILHKYLGFDKKELKSISAAITAAKQNLKSPDEIEDKNTEEIFSKYETILKEENIFDLDDLMYHSVKLFMDHPQILSNYRNKYQWIMVDEYQDVNFAQYQMIRNLAPDAGSNLCVIGDANQAIYGFRGANVKFISKFIDDYPQAAVYKLIKSYRCSDSILRASSDVIQSGGFKKVSMLKGLQKGVKIQIAPQGSDKSEAEFTARTIEKMMGGLRFFSMDSDIAQGDETENASLSDFVVLCRINRQMKVLEKAFNDHSIPYQAIEDIPFFRKEPISSIVDLLKLSINPENNFLKNKLIDKKIISRLKLAEFDDIIKNKSVKNTVAAIIDNYFSAEKADNENSFQKLLNLTDDFGNDLEEFLKFAALGTGIDAYKPNVENVTLMTLHAAKGLEFKCVFIIGCEDGLLPYSLFENQKSDIEEERRLLYVGMTRAKKYLFLSHAKKRFILGREYHLKRSPFLNKIEKELIELTKSEYKKPVKKNDNQLSLFD